MNHGALYLALISLTLWIGDGSAFPPVNYTGQACTPNSPAVQKCTSGTTSFFIPDGSPVRQIDTTHIFFFKDDSIEIGCCTPPKSNNSTDINATLAERSIAYWLNIVNETLCPMATGGKICWDATQSSDFCSAFPVMNPIKGYITSNNSMCEYMTVTLKAATFNEMGGWKCASSNNDTAKAQLTVIVGERGSVSCNIPSGQLLTPDAQMNLSCSLANYSPQGAQIDWYIGSNLSDNVLVNLNSNGNYLNHTVIVSGFVPLAPEQLVSTQNVTTACEQTNSQTNSTVRSVARYLTSSSVIVTVNSSCNGTTNICFKVNVLVNGLVAHTRLGCSSCEIPTTTPATTHTTSTKALNTTITNYLRPSASIQTKFTKAMNDQCVVECAVDSYPTIVSYRWIRNITLQNQTVIGTNRNLTVKLVVNADFGVYYCQSSNGPMNSTLDFTIELSNAGQTLQPGEIAGIVVGSVAGAVLLIIIIYVIIWRCKYPDKPFCCPCKTRSPPPPPPQPKEPSEPETKEKEPGTIIEAKRAVKKKHWNGFSLYPAEYQSH